MIKWTYNQYGNILIEDLNSDETVYLQSEADISSFLEYIGMTEDQLYIDDSDTIEDIGYFEEETQ